MSVQYQIVYTDDDDAGCPDFRMTLRAESREHAEQMFFHDDDDGWRIVSIERRAGV